MREVQQDQTPSTADFRRLMALFTTGVCVVSLDAGRGGVTAMTINSFVSVSLEPMLVSWSLQNSASQFDLYAKADRFAISILSGDQADLAQRYAARGDSLLRAEDFEYSADGLPFISGALGHLECTHWSQFEAGDHTMIVGEVSDLVMREGSTTPATPLAFFNGKFCSISG